MIIYYAHHLNVYNTKQEEIELEIIKNNFFKSDVIINPNGWIYDSGNNHDIMEQCYIFVKQSDIVVFSAIDNNIIGRGIYCELEKAFENNKKVYFLLRNALVEFYYSDFKNIELIDNGENWRRYATVRIL